MPGLQGDTVVATLGSPIKKSKLSLKFFQKKETKRVLDFSEPPQPEEPEPEETASAGCDQVVPAPFPTSPLHPTEKKEALVPFVGLNNLGNTCYLNSILQVLYYCPGIRDGVKKLCSISKRRDKPKEEACKSDEPGCLEEASPVHLELLSSFHSLITSAEQLQSSYLLHPDKHCDGELATSPRKVLNTLRQLNPMYEGYLQHDAQEVLQCILGYIQEASETIRKQLQEEVKTDSGAPLTSNGTAEEPAPSAEEDGQLSGKRKSDTEAGNAKKKPKSKKTAEDSKPFTRSKRKSSSDITVDGAKDTEGEGEEEKKKQEKEEAEHRGSAAGVQGEEAQKDVKKQKKLKRSWLRPTGKQPSIFSKFCSMGRLSSTVGGKTEEAKPDPDAGRNPEPETEDEGKNGQEAAVPKQSEEESAPKPQECQDMDLMERLFQGRLVLRTRCLECECYTERREDFQDISVPVQEDEPGSPDCGSEVSPDPKPELKTLQWAISQFASVERIVGEDKYFCETCHHYTEAERSLLFDKTPEVVTIHLKCFSANGLEMDPYAGLSKVNTPLHTPLTLSLDEWCTRPSATGGQHYQLFAVVMHSGVTISSGHYTTYIRMTDLKDTKLWPQEDEEDRGEEEKAGGPQQQTTTKEEEAVLYYDDGEVSFSLGKRSSGVASAGKMGAKKSSEGVGLLGGQRSLASYNLGASQQASLEKTDSSRSRRTASGGARKESAEEQCVPAVEGARVATEQALSSLLGYEGKWLLFDDSEVRLFEEEDFLKACSPETCSTSTPYLLFYRRIPQP